jgi:hypothetical protein
MLNPFPVLFLAPFTYFLLRVVLGFICLRIAHHIFKTESASHKKKAFGALLGGAGVLLILGLYTQIAAILSLILSSLGFMRSSAFPGLTRTSLAFMIVTSFSLFITGAGPFAFDIPL